MLTVLAFVIAAAVHSRLQHSAEWVREALRRADISVTKAAIWMEMDRALLERRLTGERPLRHADLCKLPVTFWREYGLLILSEVGPPKRLRREMLALMAVTAEKRMARMNLRNRNEVAS